MHKSDTALQVARRFPSLAKGALFCWAQVNHRLAAGHSRPDHWFFTRLCDELGYRVPVWTRLGNGMKIRVAWNDFVGRSICQKGYYELETVALLASLLKPGMIFFDVGAHVGQYSLVASERVSRNGQVHCFEPDPETYRWLLTNIQANHLGNVHSNQTAVAEETGDKPFFLATPEDIGSNSLSPPSQLRDSGRTTLVHCITLDEYIERNRIPRVDVMKIDIEGAELPMLNGARKLLGSENAPLIVIEFEEERQKAFGNSCAVLAKALFNRGYQLFYAEGGMDEYRPSMNDPRSFNVLAVPGNRLSQLKELRRVATSTVEVVA
jgi:FkbM family methyltransferase